MTPPRQSASVPAPSATPEGEIEPSRQTEAYRKPAPVAEASDPSSSPLIQEAFVKPSSPVDPLLQTVLGPQPPGESAALPSPPANRSSTGGNPGGRLAEDILDGGPTLAGLSPADSYECLIRLLPPETDLGTYRELHDAIRQNPALDGGRQPLLRLLAKKAGPCPYCGLDDRFHSPTSDCAGGD